jgi:hypothetical protein
VSETEVLSFSITDAPIHQVFLFNPGRKPRELKVLGSALAKVTELVEFTPIARHTLEPIFVLDGEVVIGADYRTDPRIIVTPSGRGARSRALKEYARRTS